MLDSTLSTDASTKSYSQKSKFVQSKRKTTKQIAFDVTAPIKQILETTQAYPTLPQGTSGLPPYHLQGIGLNSLVTPDSAFAVVDKKSKKAKKSTLASQNLRVSGSVANFSVFDSYTNSVADSVDDDVSDMESVSQWSTEEDLIEKHHNSVAVPIVYPGEPPPSEEELQLNHRITLTESDDVVLFDFPQVSVPQDLPPLPIVATIKEDNASNKVKSITSELRSDRGMVTTENNILKSEGTKPQFSITSLEFKLYLTEQQKVKKQGQGPGGGVVESDSDLGSESFRQGGALQSQASIHQASSHLQSNPTRASLTSSGLSTMGPGKGGGGVGGGGGPHGYNLIQQQRSTLYKRLTLQEEIEKVETFVDCPKEDKGTQCSESIIHDVFLEEAKKKGEKEKEKEKKGKEEDKKEGGEEEKKEEKEGGGDEDVDDGSRGGAEEDDRSDLCSICSTTSGDRDDMSVYSSVGRRRRGYDEESETVSVFNDQPSLRSDMHSMGRGRRGRSVDPLGRSVSRRDDETLSFTSYGGTKRTKDTESKVKDSVRGDKDTLKDADGKTIRRKGVDPYELSFHAIRRMPGIMEKLRMIESCVLHNTYDNEVMQYRSLQKLPLKKDSEKDPTLHLLWKWELPAAIGGGFDPPSFTTSSNEAEKYAENKIDGIFGLGGLSLSDLNAAAASLQSPVFFVSHYYSVSSLSLNYFNRDLLAVAYIPNINHPHVAALGNLLAQPQAHGSLFAPDPSTTTAPSSSSSSSSTTTTTTTPSTSNPTTSPAPSTPQTATNTSGTAASAAAAPAGGGGGSSSSSGPNKTLTALPGAGFICFWSLKNLRAPLFTVKITSSPPMTIEFSPTHSSILAVGLFDGSISIYDIRNRQSKPQIESQGTSERHTETVVDLRWIDSNPVTVDDPKNPDKGGGGGGGGGAGAAAASSSQGEQGEVLSTISLDGRVLQWYLAKGLDHTELMKLRRINPKTKQTFSDTLISRTAAGTCLDFNVADPMFYLVGTEDGLIHKCSRSYPDYIETYYSHLGGIQRVRWNPFDSDYFLSAGIDRTVRLWHHDHAAQPVISFTSFHDTPKDVVWSPVCGTVFAVGLADGSIQVWDIASSVVDPIAVTNPEPDRQIHAIQFHPDGTLLYSGDVLGCVNIYKLANIGVKKLGKPQQGEYLRTILKREVGDIYDSTPLSYTPITSLIALTREDEDGENEGIEEHNENQEEEEGNDNVKEI